MYTTVIREDFDKNIVDMTFMLTNACNYACAYCIEKIPQDHYKKQFLDLNKTLIFIEKYISLYGNMKINIRIYGGEPTLHPGIVEFCSKLNAYQQILIIEIFTNFSTDINQFNKLLNIHKLQLFISYHVSVLMCEQCFLNKLFSLDKRHLNKITCNIMLENVDETHFNNTYSLYKKIVKTNKKLQTTMLVELVPLFSTTYFTSSYNNKQMQLLNAVIKFNNTKIKFKVISDKEVKIVSKVVGYHSFNFNGWQCTSGKNAIFIDAIGNVYPCGGIYTKRHAIYKDVKMKNIFTDRLEDIFSYILCPHNSCVLCVPMVVKNISNSNNSIIDADNTFNENE